MSILDDRIINLEDEEEIMVEFFVCKSCYQECLVLVMGPDSVPRARLLHSQTHVRLALADGLKLFLFTPSHADAVLKSKEFEDLYAEPRAIAGEERMKIHQNIFDQCGREKFKLFWTGDWNIHDCQGKVKVLGEG